MFHLTSEFPIDIHVNEHNMEQHDTDTHRDIIMPKQTCRHTKKCSTVIDANSTVFHINL